METIVGLFLILVCLAAKSVGQINYSDPPGLPPINMELPNSYHIAALDEFPSQVAIILSSPGDRLHELVCQGVLVSQNWILTSASCISQLIELVNMDYLKVFLGTVDFRNVIYGDSRRAEFYMYHPDYNETTNTGKDLAMWMLAESFGPLTHHTKIANILNASERVKHDCKYIMFNQNGYLYGAPATLSENSTDCHKVGVVDDISQCVVMNITSNQNYVWGSSLMCGGKLYAIKNNYGHFTTVNDTLDWISRTMDIGANAVQLKQQVLDRMKTYDYDASFSDYDYPLIRKYPEDYKYIPVYEGTWKTNNLVNIPEKFLQEIGKGNWDKLKTGTRTSANDDVFITNRLTSDQSVGSERSFRKRRFVQSDTAVEIDHMFKSWAITVAKLNIERQITLKIDIGVMVANAERDYMEEQKKLKEIEESYNEKVH